MKRCPICQNTFDDSMRFCQIDGTLLADEAASGGLPVDPLKTMVGGAPIRDDAGDLSQFGDDETKALNSSANFPSSSGQSPFDETQNYSSSPFNDSFSAGANSSPFSNESSAPNSSPFGGSSGYGSTTFAEPPPQQTSFNPTTFDSQQNSYGQPMQQSSWTPPPAPDAGWQSQNIGANTPFAPPVAGLAGQNQTLPIVSLVCGVLGFVLICCWGGVPFGIAALITGFLGMQNAKKDPMNFGGNGLALAGMILGGISVVLSVLFIILGIAGNLLGRFGR